MMLPLSPGLPSAPAALPTADVEPASDTFLALMTALDGSAEAFASAPVLAFPPLIHGTKGGSVAASEPATKSHAHPATTTPPGVEVATLDPAALLLEPTDFQPVPFASAAECLAGDGTGSDTLENAAPIADPSGTLLEAWQNEVGAPAPGMAWTAPQLATKGAPPGKDAPSDGLAPGREKPGSSLPAAEPGLERRSDQAVERTSGANSLTSPVLAEGGAVLAESLAPPAILPSAAPTAGPSAASPLAASGTPALPPSSDALPPSAPIPYASARFAEEVGLAIARRLSPAGEVEQLVLRVEPADLGRIQVQLRFDEQGGVQAVVSADQPRVLEQLRLGSAELHRAMSDAGLRGDVAPPRFEARSDMPAGFAGTGGSTGQQGQGQGQAIPQPQGERTQSGPLTGDLLPELPSGFVRPQVAGGRVDLIA